MASEISNPKAKNPSKDGSHHPKTLDPPPCDATDTVMQDSAKAKAQYPRSLPDLPKAAQAPKTQQRTPVQPQNHTATASNKCSFKCKETFFF